MNYLGRSNMNKLLSCEMVNHITGGTQTAQDRYSFQHKVAGQIPPALWIMQTAADGFQKHLTFLLSDEKPEAHTEQEMASSQSFMNHIHAWMEAGPMRKKEIAYLDGHAKRMYDNVHEAITNYIAEPPQPLTDAFRTKLNFADTDLLRLWHTNLRFLEILLSARWPEDAFKQRRPKNMGSLAFALAIRGWLRQLHIHSASYKHGANRGGSIALMQRT